jgi:hypothetical protein
MRSLLVVFLLAILVSSVVTCRRVDPPAGSDSAHRPADLGPAAALGTKYTRAATEA